MPNAKPRFGYKESGRVQQLWDHQRDVAVDAAFLNPAFTDYEHTKRALEWLANHPSSFCPYVGKYSKDCTSREASLLATSICSQGVAQVAACRLQLALEATADNPPVESDLFDDEAEENPAAHLP